MSKISEDILLIDGLEYCNWNRELFENAHQAGLTAIHATLVYWENTEESFEKIRIWNNLFNEHNDIIVHAKTSKDILKAKQDKKVANFWFSKLCSNCKRYFSC